MKQKLREIKHRSLYYYKKNLPEFLYEDYISKRYKKSIGEDLNWSQPLRYTEKIQIAKLYNFNQLKSKLTDKVEVRSWISDKIGEQYLIPALKIYNHAEEIDFEILPDKFVIKTNHGSGTNIIVSDKRKLDIKKTVKTLKKWMSKDFTYMSDFEKHYSSIKPKIIIEEFLETPEGDLQDFKFLCFDSKVYYCWVDIGRFTDHKRNFYDLNWNLQPFTQAYSNSEEKIEKPVNFEKMISIAETLCQGLDHVRVDLYNIDGKIYFGEMTFTNGAGYERISPKEFDEKIGELWELKK